MTNGRVNWVQSFDQMAHRIHPLLFTELSVNYPMKYYWASVDSEWALDLMFRDPQRLRRLAPRLMHLGMVSLSSEDVLRFMEKKVTGAGTAFGTLLFLGADEVAVPALRLSPTPADTPTTDHLQHWAAHVVYGGSLELVRTLLRRFI